MAKNQKKYTQEFKQQIVDLYNTGNYSFPQLSSEYGVAKSTILNWVRNLSPIQVSETGKGLIIFDRAGPTSMVLHFAILHMKKESMNSSLTPLMITSHKLKYRLKLNISQYNSVYDIPQKSTA